jgi:hypothetical protein
MAKRLEFEEFYDLVLGNLLKKISGRVAESEGINRPDLKFIAREFYDLAERKKLRTREILGPTRRALEKSLSIYYSGTLHGKSTLEYEHRRNLEKEPERKLDTRLFEGMGKMHA